MDIETEGDLTIVRILRSRPDAEEVYNNMPLRRVVEYKAEYKLPFIAVDYEFITALINQGEK